MLLLGFGLLITLLVTLGSLSLADMVSTQHRIQRLVSQSVAKAYLVADMRYVARERSLMLSSMYLAKNPLQLNADLLRFDNLAARFIKDREQFEKLPLTPTEKRDFDHALAAVQRVSHAQEKAAAALLDGNDASASSLVEKAIKSQNKLLPDYTAIVNYQHEKSSQTLRMANEAFREHLLWMALLGLGVLLTCILIALKVAHLILRSEAALFHEKEQAQVTLSSIADGVITTDLQGRVEFMNPVAEALTGWSLEEANGQHLSAVFSLLDTQTKKPAEYKTLLATAYGTPEHKASRAYRLTNRSGLAIPILTSVAPIRNEGDQVIGFVVVFSDVTEAHRLSQQLAWQANHDALTGLMNRREFESRLAAALESARAGDLHHALIYVDLDQFKVVNDTCGHRAGDEMLRQLTGLLSAHVRGSDCLARLGGDEFGILLEQCTLEKGRQIAEVIRQAISEFRFICDDKIFESGASFGVASIDASSGTVASVLSEADAACYAAKDAGRNRVQLACRDSEGSKRQAEMQWISRITKALDENRLVLYAQEIKALNQASATPHFEILVRMLDEDGTLIAPSSFLPAAERYGLITAVDCWIVNAALSCLATWERETLQPPTCAINLSGQSITDEGFLGFVLKAFDEHAVLPERVCFEITETAAIRNLSHARRFIARLKAIGCTFSLDDFGTGMSSYAYLRNLGVSFLKIDGTFVKRILADDVDLAMVDAINRIGHVMGIQTIAEFAETPELVAKLRALGVDYGQGYAIHQPEPLEALRHKRPANLAAS